MSKNIEIKSIKRHSLAEKIGLKPGWKITTINGQKINDFLHYKYLITDEKIDLEAEDEQGLVKRYSIYKDFDEGLGIEFKNPLMDNIKRCKNKCIFCFVDQMPKNLRKSLYVKDDDYRLSFTSGTYISLTNLSEEDFNRIISMYMSPLYISVHATSPKVRSFMLQNPDADYIMDKMKLLKQHGINMHCQVVLCPGVNDGDILNETLKDLISIWPNVLSIAVVPVGLTKYRQHLYQIRPFTQKESRLVIDQVNEYQHVCAGKFGSRLVFVADEFYIKAGREIPQYETYEQFYQLENGVGMVALLQKELNDNMKHLPMILSNKKRISIATGFSAYEFIKEALSPLKKVNGLEYTVYPIKNNFFGHSVTVAGLITGSDLTNQLSGKNLGDRLLIPEVMLREDRLFLDDYCVDDVERILNVPITVVRVEGRDFLEKILSRKLEAKK
jgi:putative radical SAM enzyme (TIGR03279 family)